MDKFLIIRLLMIARRIDKEEGLNIVAALRQSFDDIDIDEAAKIIDTIEKNKLHQLLQ
jgi:hypothetical protein